MHIKNTFLLLTMQHKSAAITKKNCLNSGINFETSMGKNKTQQDLKFEEQPTFRPKKTFKHPVCQNATNWLKHHGRTNFLNQNGLYLF